MGEVTRKKWVDIAKGIAILAVVMGHIDYNWPNTEFMPLSDMLIWLWHVPVFFIIGGFFLKDDHLSTPSSLESIFVFVFSYVRCEIAGIGSISLFLILLIVFA